MSLSLVELCQRALRERAVFAVPDTIIGHSDPTAIRLNMAADRTGRSLRNIGGWQKMQATHAFQTIVDQADYPLPPGWLRMIGLTEWNRTDYTNLVGPVTPMQWQSLVAGNLVAAEGTQYWRIINDRFAIHPPPTSVDTVTFEYVTRNWVRNYNEVVATKEYFSADNDTCVFEDDVMVLGIKERYQAIVLGVDFTPSPEYSAIVGAGVSADAGTPVIDYGNRVVATVHLPGNIPDQGFGG